DRVDAETLSRLHQLLRHHGGDCRTFLHLVDPRRSETIIAAEALQLKAGGTLDREVSALLGYAAVSTRCAPVVPVNGEHRRRRPFRN
nr:hypothetical protein [Desulfobacterales bacterium]